MELMERYQEAALELLGKVRTTQKDVIRKAGEMVAEAAEHGQKIYFTRVVHGIEHDLISRGGGPIFYQEYKKGETALKEGDILFMGSVSGRTAEEVELAYNSVNAGVKVILLTSIAYSDAVEPVHPSGKRLYEIATLAIDMCVPVAEALLDVEGLDAEMSRTEQEAEFVVEMVEKYRDEARRSKIWGSVIVVLVVGIFATGIISGVRSSRREKQG